MLKFAYFFSFEINPSSGIPFFFGKFILPPLENRTPCFATEFLEKSLSRVFETPPPPPSMLRWFCETLSKIYSTIQKLYRIFMKKPKRSSAKNPVWRKLRKVGLLHWSCSIMSFAVMEVTLSRELSRVIANYQELKNKIERQIILCIIATMSVAFTSKLSFILLLATLICVTGTLIFLTVSMQNTIFSLQRNLFDICYRQLHSSNVDDQEREEPLGQ